MDAVAALVPSIGVALLFWYAVRMMIQADRRERAALAKMDRETGAGPAAGAGNSVSGVPASDGDARS